MNILMKEEYRNVSMIEIKNAAPVLFPWKEGDEHERVGRFPADQNFDEIKTVARVKHILQVSVREKSEMRDCSFPLAGLDLFSRMDFAFAASVNSLDSYCRCRFT